MKASPGGEIAILLFAIIMIVFFLFREIGDRNKTSWRLGLSDFLMRPVNQSNQKSFAVIGLGIVFNFFYKKYEQLFEYIGLSTSYAIDNIMKMFKPDDRK